jgi:hypothetical protein
MDQSWNPPEFESETETADSEDDQNVQQGELLKIICVLGIRHCVCQNFSTFPKIESSKVSMSETDPYKRRPYKRRPYKRRPYEEVFLRRRGL